MRKRFAFAAPVAIATAIVAATTAAIPPAPAASQSGGVT